MFVIDVERLREIIKEKRHLVVKIGESYEISRALALELWKVFSSMVLEKGGILQERVEVVKADREMAVVVMSVGIRVGNIQVEYTEVGEAYVAEFAEREHMSFALVRTAFTRAMKRILERACGEDFVNATILTLPQEPERMATEKQLDLLKKLRQEGKLKNDFVENLYVDGIIPDVNIDKLLHEKALTFKQASEILDRLGIRKKKEQVLQNGGFINHSENSKEDLPIENVNLIEGIEF